MNLKKTGNVFKSKFIGTGHSSYKKRIYRAAVSQRLRNTALETTTLIGRHDRRNNTTHPQIINLRLLYLYVSFNKHITYLIETCFASTGITLSVIFLSQEVTYNEQLSPYI